MKEIISLKKIIFIFYKRKNTIYDYENQLNKMLLSILYDKIEEKLLNDKNISYEHKLIKYYTNLYSTLDTKTFNFILKDIQHTFKLFFNLDSSIFQYLSHYYLNDNDNINFMVNIKSSGSCSFRSKDDIDVERVAREYFFGGGHTNASGGSIKMIDKINSESELIEILLNSFPIKEVG